MYNRNSLKKFNSLCKKIKSEKGEVSEEVISEAYYFAYEITPILANIILKKKKGAFLPEDDIYGFSTEIFLAIRKSFNPKKEPYDLNSFVNRVLQNKIHDKIGQRVKENKMKKDLTNRFNKELLYNSKKKYLLVDKIITVKEALNTIGEKCKKILLLSSQREKIRYMIEVLDLEISEDAMRQRLRECRKKLGRMVGGYGE